MMNYDDEDGGPEHGAIQAIMDMLESKGGELMKDKYAPEPKAEDGKPVAHGHMVEVKITPHHPGQEGGKEEEAGEPPLEEMLEHLLGEEDDGKEE